MYVSVSCFHPSYHDEGWKTVRHFNFKIFVSVVSSALVDPAHLTIASECQLFLKTEKIRYEMIDN